MNDNLKVWNAVKQVPPSFLKPIGFGKLKGKSDINPQWRIMAMTQAFGVVGHGWTYRIVRTWNESAPDGSVMCFAEVAEMNLEIEIVNVQALKGQSCNMPY